MLRLLALLGAVFFAFPGLAEAARPLTADRAHSLTVVVEAMLDERRAAIGTGVVIAQRGDTVTIATAAHVIAPGHVRVLDDRRQELAFIDSRVWGSDLALITARILDRRRFDVAPLGRAQRDGSVYLYGHPASGYWRYADATVLDPSRTLPDGSGVDGFMIACEACEHGDSGSGIFDSSGALLGVLTAAWRDSSGRVRAIQAVSIAPRLAGL